MKNKEFNELAKAHGITGKTADALRMIKVEGKTGYAAAKELLISESTISRAIKRFDRPVCECCGQVIKN